MKKTKLLKPLASVVLLSTTTLSSTCLTSCNKKEEPPVIYVTITFEESDNITITGHRSFSILQNSPWSKVITPSYDLTDGYNFDGWYYGEHKMLPEDIVKSDMTITLKAKAIIYCDISFVEGEGVNLEDKTPISVKPGKKWSEIDLPAYGLEFGYDWDGWYNGQQIIDLEDTITTSVVLTAKAKEKEPTPVDQFNIDVNTETNEATITGVKDHIHTSFIIPSEYEIDDKVYPITTIAEGAFSYDTCSEIKYIKLPNSITTIEPNAFENCTGLESFTLTKSVTSVADYYNTPFANCSNLKTLIINECNPETNYRYLINNTSSITNLVIKYGEVPSPQSGDGFFSHCEKLTSVTFRNVTTIGENAFKECLNLKTIEFGSVQTINDSAFSLCSV